VHRADRNILALDWVDNYSIWMKVGIGTADSIVDDLFLEDGSTVGVHDWVNLSIADCLLWEGRKSTAVWQKGLKVKDLIFILVEC
jgi:hypothetical protein